MLSHRCAAKRERPAPAGLPKVSIRHSRATWHCEFFRSQSALQRTNSSAGKHVGVYEFYSTTGYVEALLREGNSPH